MEILKVNNLNIKKAVGVLKDGGVVVFPTETAYGLAADASNRRAVKKVYRIKGRSFKKFLPLICSSLSQVRNFFLLTKEQLRLAKQYWPRDLTIILKPCCRNRPCSSCRTGQGVFLQPGQKDCAVRVSSYKLARDLAKGLGRPITATSANVSGGQLCYSMQEVMEQFKDRQDKPDLFLDGGRLKKRKPSTIVRVLAGGRLKVLRQGEIKVTNG